MMSHKKMSKNEKISDNEFEQISKIQSEISQFIEKRTFSNKKDVEYSVLSCYYFPGKDYSLLTDSMKTINTFRLIFNMYFSHDLQLLN